jgi:hypothetical protein
MALIGKVQRGQPITADMMNNIIDSIRECQLQSIVGGVFKRGVGGTTITVKAGRQQEEQVVCPFTPTATAVSGGYEVTFSTGTVNGLLPTNMFDKLTGVTTSARTYFYINCNTDGKMITSCVIEKSQTIRVPQLDVPDVAPSELNILISTMSTAGIIETTIPCANISAKIYPTIQTDKEEFSAGQRNFIQFYNWVA